MKNFFRKENAVYTIGGMVVMYVLRVVSTFYAYKLYNDSFIYKILKTFGVNFGFSKGVPIAYWFNFGDLLVTIIFMIIGFMIGYTIYLAVNKK